MSDLITINKIRASGKHGVSDLERAKPQVLDIDVEIEVDMSTSAESDSLSDTVDYSSLHRQIVTIVETKSFKLLEALSNEIIVSILTDKRIRKARVKVAKPGKLSGATPAITLERNNE